MIKGKEYPAIWAMELELDSAWVEGLQSAYGLGTVLLESGLTPKHTRYPNAYRAGGLPLEGK